MLAVWPPSLFLFLRPTTMDWPLPSAVVSPSDSHKCFILLHHPPTFQIPPKFLTFIGCSLSTQSEYSRPSLNSDSCTHQKILCLIYSYRIEKLISLDKKIKSRNISKVFFFLLFCKKKKKSFSFYLTNENELGKSFLFPLPKVITRNNHIRKVSMREVCDL